MAEITEEADDELPREPSLDAIISQAMRDMGMGEARGWQDLDQRQLNKEFQAQQHKQQEAFKREANIFRDVLWANPRGRQLLELLLDNTLRRRTWPNALLTDPHALMAEGIWREAENSFVWAMVDAIAVAENQKPKGREV